MSNLINIKTFISRHEAGIAKGLLDEKEIPCFIQADDCGGIRPHLQLGMGNVRLMVHEFDRERASEALKIIGDNNMENNN